MSSLLSSKDLKTYLDTRPKIERTPFGIFSIDALTDGFSKGEFIIITGYSGHGKTSFCRSLTYNLAERGKKILWFSFEETQTEFLGKFLGTVPDFYIPEENKYYDLPWVENTIEFAKQELGTEVVFIDHLEYIVPIVVPQGHNKPDLIGDTCRQLRQIAIRNNVTIFLLTHTKQPVEDQLPTMASIKGSASIIQEASAAYCLNRIKDRGMRSGEFGNDSLFIVLKQRHKGTMGRKARITYYNNRFVEALPEDTNKFIG
jgi:replicative DNA helicase